MKAKVGRMDFVGYHPTGWKSRKGETGKAGETGEAGKREASAIGHHSLTCLVASTHNATLNPVRPAGR
jgi:hypothetical protein